MVPFVPITHRDFFSELKDTSNWGKGFCKFNSSLTSSADYVEKTENENFEILPMLDQDKNDWWAS